MADNLVLAFCFLPLLMGVAAYVYARGRFRSSRSLFAFDSGVLALAALLSVAFWWREITGRVPQYIWLDEHDFLAVLIPLWATVISAPVLITGALLRYFLFSKLSVEATRAV